MAGSRGWPSLLGGLRAWEGNGRISGMRSWIHESESYSDANREECPFLLSFRFVSVTYRLWAIHPTPP